MLRSTAATRSSRQLVEALVISSSSTRRSRWAPRASWSARSFTLSVPERTFQNMLETRSIVSRVMSHWYSIWNAHSRALVRLPTRTPLGRRQRTHGRHHGDRRPRRFRALVVGTGLRPRARLRLRAAREQAEA